MKLFLSYRAIPRYQRDITRCRSGIAICATRFMYTRDEIMTRNVYVYFAGNIRGRVLFFIRGARAGPRLCPVLFATIIPTFNFVVKILETCARISRSQLIVTQRETRQLLHTRQ